ncbi:hypothetical protein [Streptomyces sp. bgisy031]|uniref:hypothetical protein n=1 Tax=Streptomyces sp. bgisy031 TaxID=3413772 RepID=UPI003D746316
MTGLAAATFSLCYALTNPLLQAEHLSVRLLRAEIANGHLALRVTSVVVGFSFFLMFWRVSRDPAPRWSMGHAPEEDSRLLEREMRRGIWTLERALAQGVLFMLVLVGLWIFVITEHSSVLISLVNWLFLFISDDFLMCANYISYRKAAPPMLDAVKIVLGSLGTVVVFLVILFQQFDRRIAWGALAFTLMTTAVMLYRAFSPGLWTFASTFGILPEEEDWRPDEDEEVLVSSIRKLEEQGVLTEAEAEKKLRLVPLLYEHGVLAYEIVDTTPTLPGQQDRPATKAEEG